MTELWTPEQVAEHMGVKPDSVRRALHRLGVRPVAREPGRAGRNLYDPAQVRAAAAGMPRKSKRGA